MNVVSICLLMANQFKKKFREETKKEIEKEWSENMNNIEAREVLKRDLGIMIKNKCLPDSIEAIELAINALEVIDQLKRELDIAISQLDDVGLSIGDRTDGVRIAVNKQIAIRPKEVMGLYNSTYYICPVCGNSGLTGNYCDECGQRINMN